MHGIIYKITNQINGKIYIGQTICTIKKRFWEHCYYKKNTAISRAIQKYGKENFEIIPIDFAETYQDLNGKEKRYIFITNSLSPNGYNITEGGSNGKHSRAVSKELRDYYSELANQTAKKLGPKDGKKSKYKGVTYNKIGDNWFAQIKINGKRIHLGAYKTEIEAAKAYDLATSLYRTGECYYNFPEQIDENAFDNRIKRTIDPDKNKSMQKSILENHVYKGRDMYSQYKGVTRYNDGKFRRKPWKSILKHKSVVVFRGAFETELAAAIAYDWAVRKFIGPDAYVNFPESELLFNILEDKI